MNNVTHRINPSRSSTRPLRRGFGIALAVAFGVVGLAACGSDGTGLETEDGKSPAAGEKGTKAPRVLWMGDSIGEVEAPALGAALQASDGEFKSMAAAGGGGVLGPVAKLTWEQLPKELKSFKPDVVVYQISTYDWGQPEDQRAGYEKFVRTVDKAGAELVFVTAPPFKMDKFYKPHEAEIKTAPEAARKVADRHQGKVGFLDASALWGTDSSAAKAQRSKDGIHSCQQGSAEFAQWLTRELGKQYDFTPAAADKWATGSWTGDKLYGRLGCE